MSVTSDRVAATLLLVVVCTGCKSSDSAPVTAGHTDAASETIKGWVETKGAGVAFSLPEELPVVDLSSGDLNKMTKQAQTLYPKNKDMQTMLTNAMKSKTMKLIAFDKSNSTPTYRSTFSLTEEPQPNDMDAKKLLAADIAQFKKVPGLVMTKAVVLPLPIGNAVFIEAEISIADRKVDLSNYTLLRNSTAYEFSFACAPTVKDKWRDMAQKSMETARFLE